jgi:hypothetical protein
MAEISGNLLTKGLVFNGKITLVIPPAGFLRTTFIGSWWPNLLGWYVTIVNKYNGAPYIPIGEMQVISQYNRTNGEIFTIAGFTAPINAGDEIYVIHPDFASIFGTLNTVNTNVAALLVSPAVHGFSEKIPVLYSGNLVAGVTRRISFLPGDFTTQTIIRSFSFNCSTLAGANFVDVSLARNIGLILTVLKTFRLDVNNNGSFDPITGRVREWTLMDMFGESYIAGNQFEIQLLADGANAIIHYEYAWAQAT